MAFSGDKLGVSGHFVDHIIAIGETWEDENKSDYSSLISLFTRIPYLHAVLNGWEEVCQLGSVSTYFANGESMLHAYWKTVLLGYTETDKSEDLSKECDQVFRSRFRGIPSIVLRWLGFIVMIPSALSLLKEALALQSKATKTRWDAGRHQLGNGSQPRQAGRISEHDGAGAVNSTTELSFVSSMIAFREAMSGAKNRRMIRTTQGYIGLAPALARKGDLIALCRGGKVPLVLRDSSSTTEQEWSLIGDCYVRGIMNGAAFRAEECRELWIR